MKITATNSAGYEAPIGLLVHAVIFTVLGDDLCVLLVERDEPPQQYRWALPGGFANSEETPDETVTRKLQERTGMGPVYMEQLRTYADPRRDPRGWLPAISYLALVPATELPQPQPAKDGKWFAVWQLPQPLAFDHAQMVADGVERIRGKLWYSNIAVGVLPEQFTLRQARAAYEAIAGRHYDPANFRRDLKNSGLIVPTGKKKAEGRGRPAELYTFKDRTPTWGPSYAKGI